MPATEQVPGGSHATPTYVQLLPWIRRARHRDVPHLLRVFNVARASAGCFPGAPPGLDRFRALLAYEDVRLAELGGEIAGFVGVWAPERFIHHLYVHPCFQRKGVGTALLRACEGLYGRPLSLKSLMANNRARRYYRSLGWEPGDVGTTEEGPWQRWWLRERPPARNSARH